jgi:hypothetical protein
VGVGFLPCFGLQFLPKAFFIRESRQSDTPFHIRCRASDALNPKVIFIRVEPVLTGSTRIKGEMPRLEKAHHPHEQIMKTLLI